MFTVLLSLYTIQGITNSSTLSWENIKKKKLNSDTSLVAQMVKHVPTIWETRVQSLGQEDLLEKEMVTHSSTLAWKIPWTEEPGKL